MRLIRTCRYAGTLILMVWLAIASAQTMPNTSLNAHSELERAFKQVEKVLYQGDYATGGPQMEALLRKSQQQLGEHDLLTLKIHDYHGGVLRRLGKLPQARQEFERILELHRQSGTEDSLLALASLNNLAAVIEAQVSPKAALPLYERAMAQRSRIVGDDHLESVTVLDDYASALGESGRLHEALPLLERALRLREAGLGATHAWTLTTRNNLGHLFFRLGRLQESLDLNERNLKARLEGVGEHHPTTWTSMSNTANALLHLGRLEEAQVLHERALALKIEKLGATTPSVMASRKGVAGVLLARGRFVEAERQYLQLVQDAVKIYGESHRQVQSSRIGLAEVYARMGRLKDADAELEAASAGYQALYGSGHFSLLEVDLLRASVSCRAGRAKSASAELALLVQQIEAQYGRDFSMMPRAQAALAECLLEAGDLSVASRLFEQLTADSASGETDFELWHDPRSPQQARLGVLFRRQAQALAGLGEWARAYQAQEQSKSRQLLAQLSERALAISAGVPETAWYKMQVAQERVYAAKAALRQLDKPQERPSRVVDLQDAAQAVRGIRSEWNKLYPSFRLLGHISQPDLARDAALLPRDALYVSYRVDPKGRLFAFTLDAQSELRWHVLGEHAGLSDAVEAFRFYVQHGLRKPQGNLTTPLGQVWTWQVEGAQRWRVIDASVQPCAALPMPMPNGVEKCHPAEARMASEEDIHALRASLSRVLLKPMLEHSFTKTYARWIISADGNLGALPFDVLEWNKQPVVASVAVSQVQSLAVLGAQTNARSAGAKAAEAEIDLFALGNPNFSSAPLGRTLVPPPSVPRLGGPTMLAPRIQPTTPPIDWAPLPSSELEIMLAAEPFEMDKTYVLSGTKASKAEVINASSAGVLAKAKYALFATHLWLHPDRPQDSVLALSPSASSQGNSDKDSLSVAEVMGLRMGTELTVISACSSALADMQAGTQTAIGFAYALQVAGNKNTLLTLWPVYDRSTAHFVGRLFHHVARGADHSLALQLTKREFLTHPNKAWREPSRWAGFILVGR